MKRISVVVMVVLCSILMMVGCTEKKVETVASDLPSWVLVPPEGGICAVGSAKIGAAGTGFARTEAAASARDEIARILNVRVKNMFKNFTETTGVGDEQTVDKVTTSVTKQLAKVDLSGSIIKNVYRDLANKELYVLVAVKPEVVKQVADTMRQAAVNSFKNEKALWQKFQAKKGQEELENQIEKEFGGM